MDEPAGDGGREPRQYRVWSGKIALADEDAGHGVGSHGMSEVWLDNLTKVIAPRSRHLCETCLKGLSEQVLSPSEDQGDAVLIMKARRPVWLRCGGDLHQGGTREKLAKAVADTAISQLGIQARYSSRHSTLSKHPHLAPGDVCAKSHPSSAAEKPYAAALPPHIRHSPALAHAHRFQSRRARGEMRLTRCSDPTSPFPPRPPPAGAAL